MNKLIEVYPYNGILFSNRKERTFGTLKIAMLKNGKKNYRKKYAERSQTKRGHTI